MFNKIEFSDINRYFASIGTILIALAFLLPYFYLKESFGIIVSENDYKSYTKISQAIISNKQSNILFFQSIIVYISGGLFIIGLFLTILGITRWNKRQMKIDEKFDKELEKLKIEITQMSPAEKEEKINSEIQEIVNSEELTQSGLIVDNIRNEYRLVEDTILNKYNKINQNKFIIYPNVRLKHTEYDILLKSNSNEYIDELVEIRFYKNRIIPNLLYDNIRKFDYRIQYYSNNVRDAKGILFLVYDDKNINKIKIDKLDLKSIDLISDIDIKWIKLSELQSFQLSI